MTEIEFLRLNYGVLKQKVSRLERLIQEIRAIPRALVTYETVHNTIADEKFLWKQWDDEERKWNEESLTHVGDS